MSSPPPAREIFTSHYFSPPTRAPLHEYSRHTVPLSVRGITLRMATGDGVFSKDKLDAGSRLLLETLLRDRAVETAKTLCDLGCGWGAVGCFLAAHFQEARISMCDVNPRAAHLAAFNARQNNLKNALSWYGDGLSAARAEYFDLIACNPPIRAGNSVIQKLFDDAQRGLKNGGGLMVVIRTAQGAKSWQKKLGGLFGNCETAALESGYRVLKCVK